MIRIRAGPFLTIAALFCFICTCILGRVGGSPPPAPDTRIAGQSDKVPRDTGTRHVQSVLHRQHRRVLMI